jgi:hypothetical protein
MPGRVSQIVQVHSQPGPRHFQSTLTQDEKAVAF